MQIKKLVSIEDFEKAVQTQKAVWHFEDRDLMPAHFMIAAKNFAEQWGVFHKNKILALALAYPAGNSDIFLLHMLGVIQKYRNKGLGNELLKKVNKIYIPVNFCEIRNMPYKKASDILNKTFKELDKLISAGWFAVGFDIASNTMILQKRKVIISNRRRI
jgi:predicted GNAT superfamily acetyltransferase